MSPPAPRSWRPTPAGTMEDPGISSQDKDSSTGWKDQQERGPGKAKFQNMLQVFMGQESDSGIMVLGASF